MNKTIPPIKPPGENPEDQNRSDEEAEKIDDETLDRVAKRNDHNRKENIKNIVHFFGKWIFIILNIGILSGMLVLFFHLLAPPELCFLDQHRLDVIKTIFFSALATHFAKSFYNKIA